MFNPLDFIDSKAVREYNKDTVFTPMEQALIIYHSRRATVEDRLNAWRELLDRYDENDFTPPYHEREGCTNRRAVEDTVRVFEKALSDCQQHSNVVFKAMFYEELYPDNIDESLFSNYDLAFDHIKALKQEYLDDDSLKDVAVSAKIKMIELNTDKKPCTIFSFDNEMQMTNIVTDAIEPTSYVLDNYFLYLPLPFKKGDVLKTTYRGKTWYGIVRQDIDASYFSLSFPNGDSADMCISLCLFDGAKNYFYIDHMAFLDIDVCGDDELPDNQKILLLLKKVYLGESDIGDFLFLYTYFGENAYQQVYGGTIPNSV